MRQQFIQTLQEYTGDASTAQSLGAAMLQCNGMIVPNEFPHIALLIANFQRPVVTHNEAADYNVAGGAQFHVSGAPKNRYESQWQMIETDSLQVTKFAEALMAQGGMVDCTVYDGRQGRYLMAHELKDCAITFEPIDYEGEGVSSIVRVSAQVKYNYYGTNAALGSSNSVGKISGVLDSAQSTLNKANSVLNAVYAGNSLLNSMKNIF